MSTLPVLGNRPGLPSLPVLGEHVADSGVETAVYVADRATTGAAITGVAEAADTGGGRYVVHAKFGQ